MDEEQQLYDTPVHFSTKGKGRFLKIVEAVGHLNKSHYLRNGKIDLDLCRRNLNLFATPYFGYTHDDFIISFIYNKEFNLYFSEEPLGPLKNLLLEYFRENEINSISSIRLGDFWRYVELNGISTSVIQIMLNGKLCETFESLGFRIENKGKSQWTLLN